MWMRKACGVVIIAVLGLFAACTAWASCSAATVSTDIVLPPELHIPRNNGWSAGTVLWSSGWVGGDTVKATGCEPALDRQSLGYAQAIATTSVGGAYATSIPGVGVQVAWLPSTQSPSFGALPSRVVTWPASVRDLSPASSEISLPSRFQLRLVKTGAISAGVLVLPSPLAVVNFGAARVAELHVASGVRIAISSCVTPDVNVDLGEWKASTLQAVGSTTPAVPFQVDIRDCPAGLNGISYRFTSREALSEAGIIGPKQLASTATGVGIRMSWRDNSPVLISRLLDVIYVDGGEPTDDPSQGGDFAIPMQASFYRLPTGALVAGRVVGEVEFTMYYE